MTHVLHPSDAFSFLHPSPSTLPGVGFDISTSPLELAPAHNFDTLYPTTMEQNHFMSPASVSSYPVSFRSSLSSNIGSSLSTTRTSNSKKEPDQRRNLYVLGIPTDLTQDEFEDIFSTFGTVEHSVIMATLDQFNRRRGFIVMSTHLESHAAMKGLTGIQIRGSQLHVSFAVVQRSEGFLDGGDRVPRRPHPQLQSRQRDHHGSSSPDGPIFNLPALTSGTSNLSSSPPLPFSHPSTGPRQMSFPQLNPSLALSPLATTLIALNLCPSFFPTAASLHTFFSRFGHVRAVRLATGSAAGIGGADMPGTGVVAFESERDALHAADALDGVPIGSFVVRVMDARL